MYSRRNPLAFFVVDGEGFFKLTLFQSENFLLQFIYPHLCSMFFLRHLQQSDFNLLLFPRKFFLCYGRCPCGWCQFTWCVSGITDASCLMIKINLSVAGAWLKWQCSRHLVLFQLDPLQFWFSLFGLLQRPIWSSPSGFPKGLQLYTLSLVDAMAHVKFIRNFLPFRVFL